MTLTAIRRDLGLGTGAAALDVIGIDLSGPCNAADTAVAAFRANGRRLVLQERLVGADDAAIAALIARTRPDADLVVGLDAPLSYNDGGGDRPADRLLRAGRGCWAAPRFDRAADANGPKGPGSVYFPRRTLIAISQSVAGLMRTSVSAAAIGWSPRVIVNSSPARR